MSLRLKVQDMPPAGGYSAITYKRIPPKSFFNGASLFAMYIGVTGCGLYLFSLTYRARKKEEVEMRSARMAITPMLLAEKDREFLKQMRKNRDYEADLMKDVEGWTVGKYYNEPIYRTLPENSVLTEPIDSEWYAHSSQKDWWKRYRINQYA